MIHIAGKIQRYRRERRLVGAISSVLFLIGQANPHRRDRGEIPGSGVEGFVGSTVIRSELTRWLGTSQRRET